MVSLAQLKRQAEDQSMKALQDRREQTRKQFFDNRKDISNNRLDRRQIQSDLMDQFKNKQMERVGGTGVYDPVTGKFKNAMFQSRTPGGPTLADKAQELAFKYGPTFSEIGSDIGYATDKVMSGLAKLPGQLIDAYKELSPVSRFVQGIESFFQGPSQIQKNGFTEVPRESTTMDQQKIDTQTESTGASPDFLAAINDPMTMAREFNLERLLNQARALENLGNTNLGKFGIEGFRNPTFTFDKPIGEGNLFFKANPSKNLYDLGYTMTFANGGVANL